MQNTGEGRTALQEAEGLGAWRQEKCGRLAVRALEACRNQLFFRYRYLEQALFRLEWTEGGSVFFGSNGEYLYFDCKYILKRYFEDAGQLTMDYLHTVMHCLYQHPFFCPQESGEEDQGYWDLASDLAVACVLQEITEEDAEETERKRAVLQKLEGETGGMSAQKIYAYLRRNALPGRTICGMDFRELCALFRRDEHCLWYRAGADGAAAGDGAEKREGRAGRDSTAAGDGAEEREGTTERDSVTEGDGAVERAYTADDSGTEKGGRAFGGLSGSSSIQGSAEPEDTGERKAAGSQSVEGQCQRSGLQRVWKDAAARVLMAAQASPSSGRGEIPGNLLLNLRRVTRENCDYTEFLTKFAGRMEERMLTDEDEFDYVYYTYGLKLFGKVPLVEPLEYREKKLIREFVIAIDTSGSCQGELVEGFLRRTCGILQQTESFSARVNIHILQCDACIQEDTRIRSRQDLEAYIAGLTLKGFGGTDFTPVFAYVDELIGRGEIGRLDGLVYFTDGYGRFPAKPPRYRTAFVFLDKDDDVKVPPWAMKVYLDKT